jgi:hypothetical protein
VSNIWDSVGTASPPVTGSPVTNDVPVWNGTAWVPQHILTASITDGTILGADIDPAAAIPYSKLNLANSIVSGDIVDGTLVNADINAAAAIAYSKLALAASVKNADLVGSGGVLADMPPGRELTYNEFTATVVCSATTEGTATTIVTASAFTFDGATPVIVEFFCPSVATGTTSPAFIILSDGGTSLGNVASTSISALTIGPFYSRRRLIPSNASHTYSIRVYVTGSNNATNVQAGVGGPGVTLPGFIRISKA